MKQCLCESLTSPMQNCKWPMQRIVILTGLRTCSRHAQWRIQGRVQGCPAPFTFRPNWGPKKKAEKTIYDRPPPPPPLIAGSGWPFPPYLKVWIRHCKVITDPLFSPFFCFIVIVIFFLLFSPLYFCTQLTTKIKKKGQQKLLAYFHRPKIIY